MEQLKLEQRRSEERCAFCHDRLGEAFAQCPSCATRVHVACSLESGACPSLGCGHLFAKTKRRPPFPRLEVAAAGMLMLSWILVFWLNIHATPSGRALLMLFYAALAAGALFYGVRSLRRGLRKILLKD